MRRIDNEEDYELLKSLLDITSKINDIYDLLYYLEATNQKGSIEYSCAIDTLKVYLHDEEIIYEGVSQSSEKKRNDFRIFISKSRTWF